MKDHIQTIINVCLAVSITFLIYQNTQLKERLSTLDLATLEMSIENDITLANLKSGQTMIKERVGIEVIPESKFGGEPVYWTVNERLTSYGLVVVENQSRLDTNESEIQAIAESIADIERSTTKQLMVLIVVNASLSPKKKIKNDLIAKIFANVKINNGAINKVRI